MPPTLRTPSTRRSRDDVPSEYLFESEEKFAGCSTKRSLAERVRFRRESLVGLFENAKTFGSLIQVPPKMAAKLPEIEKRLERC